MNKSTNMLYIDVTKARVYGMTVKQVRWMLMKLNELYISVPDNEDLK